MRATWLSLLFVTANGWWDEGHMLVASVARTWLLDPPAAKDLPWTSEQGRAVVAKFDQVFNHWEYDFPQYTNLVSASVWADHIKCRSRSSICDNSYGIQIFNEIHYVDVFYNRTMSAEERRRHLVAATERKDNAIYLLKSIHNSLVSSSAFTANLLVRLFIHVFGDIHQPLHTMNYRGDCLPLGDRGGNDILVTRATDEAADATDTLFIPSQTTAPQAFTLHGLWDSAGWQYGRSYPAFSVAESNQIAATLAARHPNVTFTDYRSVIRDSYSLAPQVYGPVIEAVCRNATAGHLSAFVVTPEYLQMVRTVSEERIAAAGFSLAYYLHMFADRVVVAANPPLVHDTSADFWKIYSVALTLIVLLLLIWNRVRQPRPPTLTTSNGLYKARWARDSQKSLDTMSCGTSDNVSERLVQTDLEDQLTAEFMPPGRVIVSNSIVTMKARK